MCPFLSVAFGHKILHASVTIPLHLWNLQTYMFLCRLQLIQFLRIGHHIRTAPSVLGTTNKLLYHLLMRSI